MSISDLYNKIELSNKQDEYARRYIVENIVKQVFKKKKVIVNWNHTYTHGTIFLMDSKILLSEVSKLIKNLRKGNKVRVKLSEVYTLMIWNDPRLHFEVL